MSDIKKDLEIGLLIQRVHLLEEKFDKLDKDFIELGTIIKKNFAPQKSTTKLTVPTIEIPIPPPPLCGKCGTKMTMDIATLNTLDWYCPKCCKKNPMSPLYEYEYPSTPIPIEILIEKAEKVKKMYPDFNEYILKFMEAGEIIVADNKYTESDIYKISKEVVELLNPENNTTAEEQIKQLDKKVFEFMNDCFDQIIADYNLGEEIKESLI